MFIYLQSDTFVFVLGWARLQQFPNAVAELRSGKKAGKESSGERRGGEEG